jgi:hypothetical protein
MLTGVDCFAPYPEEGRSGWPGQTAALHGLGQLAVCLNVLPGLFSVRSRRVRHGGNQDGPDDRVHHDKPGDG